MEKNFPSFFQNKARKIFFKENYIHNITLLNLLKRNYTFFSPMINGCWVWHNLRKLLKTFLFCFAFLENMYEIPFHIVELLILSRYVSFTHNSVAVFHSFFRSVPPILCALCYHIKYTKFIHTTITFTNLCFHSVSLSF